MEPKSPESFQPLKEVSFDLHPNLKTLLNTSLNEVLGNLSNNPDTNDKKYQSYLSKIYKLEGSILEPEDNNPAPFSVLEENLNEKMGLYSIVFPYFKNYSSKRLF